MATSENPDPAPAPRQSGHSWAEGTFLYVEDALAGSRIEDWLAERWPEVARTRWRRALRQERILVNGASTHPQRRLAAGDAVQLRLDPGALGGRPGRRGEGKLAPAVLAEADWVVILDKPAGMHTVPDRAGKYRGVYGWLRDARPGEDLRIVHRLDVGTSGCLAIAKGLAAARRLDAAFRAGDVGKEYLALVDGVVGRDELDLRGALGPDRRRPGTVRVVPPREKGARRAWTQARVERRFRRHTLLRVVPRTGRSHQIRVHLAHAGHPVVGDPVYGSPEPLLLSRLKPGYKLRPGLTERPLLERPILHAAQLELQAPAGGERLRAAAPLPAELALALDKLERFGRVRGRR